MGDRTFAALGVLALIAVSVAVAALAAVGPAAADAGGTTVTGPWGAVHLPPGGGYRGTPPQRLAGVHAAASGSQVASSNWSGYVESGEHFTGVSGSWTVPSVTPSTAFADAAPWVGIDGVTDSTLIQTGTDTETENGHTTSFAWVEWLPNPAQMVGPVTPGDQMTGSVTQTGPGQWTISIADSTSGQSFTQPVAYNTPGDNAEWITEAIFHNGQNPQMAPYGTVPFSGVSVQPASTGLTSTPFVMKDSTGNIVSYPSPQAGDGSFSTIYGSPSSPPPTTSTTSTTTPSSTSTSTSTPTSGKQVTRLAGADRIATAVAISQDTFPQGQSASAAVLATSTAFADALTGTPLAAAKSGPLLLTAGDALSPATSAELQRVLQPGSTVYLLGGTSALSDAVATAVQNLGFTVVRYSGTNRFGTATAVAELGLGAPTTILEADGTNFPDALAAGAAAAKAHGAVLLTLGTTASPETTAYLSAHPALRKYGVGGAAAAADPSAAPLVGADRYETSTVVAKTFFTSPSAVGIASGATFPDALAGGADIAAKGGPMILVPPAAPLPAAVTHYLQANASAVSGGFAYGGAAAVGDDVLTAVSQALG